MHCDMIIFYNSNRDIRESVIAELLDNDVFDFYDVTQEEVDVSEVDEYLPMAYILAAGDDYLNYDYIVDEGEGEGDTQRVFKEFADKCAAKYDKFAVYDVHM